MLQTLQNTRIIYHLVIQILKAESCISIINKSISGGKNMKVDENMIEGHSVPFYGTSLPVPNVQEMVRENASKIHKGLE